MTNAQGAELGATRHFNHVARSEAFELSSFAPLARKPAPLPTTLARGARSSFVSARRSPPRRQRSHQFLQMPIQGNLTTGLDSIHQDRSRIGEQRKEISAGGEVSVAGHDILASHGQPLDANTRAFMERRFGRDFRDVRIHTGPDAEASARAVSAHAYTVGQHIVFGSGGFAAESRRGCELLAHELTHVVQQSTDKGYSPGMRLPVDPSPAAELEAQRLSARVMNESTPSLQSVGPFARGLQRLSVSLQRSFGDGECTSKGVPCATGEACATPDSPATASLGPSTAWSLTVNIDTEASSWENALRTQLFGHAFVRFSENSGQQYTYGFYPASQVPNENNRSVPGCVHHPDTTHDRCTDSQVTYSLTQPQYDAALAAAQNICRTGHQYGQKFTCATFALQIAQAAGQAVPSSKSEPTSIFQQAVPPIDNPNTLAENVTGELEKDPTKRGFWNSATPPPLRLQAVPAISLNDDPGTAVFKLNWLPVGGATFRWHLLDSQDRHYLMRSGDRANDVLDWLDFTAHSTAVIGQKTRVLLKERGVSAGSVECSVRFPVKGWATQILKLPVAFV